MDGMLVETACMTLITCPGSKDGTFCVVPDGILSIGAFALSPLEAGPLQTAIS